MSILKENKRKKKSSKWVKEGNKNSFYCVPEICCFKTECNNGENKLCLK